MLIRVLPNRQIFLVLSPREASMLSDQILDPQAFPWQDSESEVTAMGAKAGLKEAVDQLSANELGSAIDALLLSGLEREEEESTEENEPSDSGSGESPQSKPDNWFGKLSTRRRNRWQQT